MLRYEGEGPSTPDMRRIQNRVENPAAKIQTICQHIDDYVALTALHETLTAASATRETVEKRAAASRQFQA